MESNQILLPDSILVNIDLAHLRNASSTFSPVNALVSKNIISRLDKSIKQTSKM